MTGILVAAAIILMAGWGLRRPFAGLLAVLAVNLIQPGELYPNVAPLHLEKIVAIAVLVSFFAHNHRLKFPPVIQRCLWFYASVIVSIPLSIWVSNAITNAEQFGKTMIYVLLITALINAPKRLLAFQKTFVLVMGFFAVTSMVSYFQGKFAYAEGFDRIVGLTSNVNSTDYLALTMASALPLIVLLAHKDSGKIFRIIAIAIAGLVLATMLLTGSRVTLAAFMIAVAFAVLTGKKRLIRGVALLLLALVAWIALPTQYKVRYTKETDAQYLDHDESYTGRLRIWANGWKMFLDHPLTGVGIGDFAIADGSLYWSHHWMDAHNLGVKLIGELGIVGTVAFLAFVVGLVRTNFALRRAMEAMPDVPYWQRAYPRAANITITILTLVGYGDHDLYRDTWYILAGLSGALWCMLKDAGQLPGVDGEKALPPASVSADAEETAVAGQLA